MATAAAQQKEAKANYKATLVIDGSKVEAAAKLTKDTLGDALIAVDINRYRDGSDYISPHSDDDYGDAKPTIPSLTLGAARPFRLARMAVNEVNRMKLDKTTTVEFLPSHGDLLVMRGSTNAEWQHWVPKTAKPVGERINLTFRYRGVR